MSVVTLDEAKGSQNINLSSNLNDTELDNLVSLLVGEENTFEGLHNLYLPHPPQTLPNNSSILQDPNTREESEELQLEDINDLLTFHDALYYQPNETLSPLFPLDHTPWTQTTPNYSNPELVQQTHSEINSLRKNVLHDHTYSLTREEGEPPKSAMLTTLGSDLSCDLSGRVSDDNEEENSSDGGYETMSTSSPGSTQVGGATPPTANTTSLPSSPPLSSPPLSSPPLSSPSLSSSSLPSPLPSLPPSSLPPSSLIDPVKLIDERIKFFMSRQQVHLTEEEKETLTSEGLPIPTTLPLTKTEERALKTVRRKIRNKVAAQESRNKKKKYMESLEERLKTCTHDNRKLIKKVETLETENHTLRQQLIQLQQLVARATNPLLGGGGGGRTVHLGSCLMVIVLCFGILFGNLLPYKVSITDTTTTGYTAAATVRSRALLSVPPQDNTWWSYTTDYWNYVYDFLLPSNSELTPPTKDHAPYLYYKQMISTQYYCNHSNSECPQMIITN